MTDSQLREPSIAVPQLEPLLARGDLIWMPAARRNGPTRSYMLSRYNHSEGRLLREMRDPLRFARALVQGSQATLLPSGPGAQRFQWQIDLPLVGTSGEMRLREGPSSSAGGHTLLLDAESGAMQGGAWRFRTIPLRAQHTALLGWSETDVSEGIFLLRTLIEADPSFRAGLGASAQLMLARALRIRLRS